mgnify:CR=1 FL=1
MLPSRRIGQTDELLIQYVLIQGTVDELIACTLQRKQEAMSPLYRSSASHSNLHSKVPLESEAELMEDHLAELRMRESAARKKTEEARWLHGKMDRGLQERQSVLAKLRAEREEYRQQIQDLDQQCARCD